MATLLVGAATALFFGGSRRKGASIAIAASVIVAAACGLIPVVQVLAGGLTLDFRLPWQVPYGEFFIELDPLSAWFLLPTLLLSAMCAIYGVGYLSGQEKQRSLGPVSFFYNLLVLGMILVLLARNAVLFISAWELMAVSSFFLVTFDHERESVRSAGWIYLVATHLGTGFLLVFFILTARETGSMDFTLWAARGIHNPQDWPELFFCWRWLDLEPRPASCRCMSGCRRRIPPRPATSRR